MKTPYKILHLEDVHTDAELAARELRRSNIEFEHCIVDNEKAYIGALESFDADIILCDHALSNFSSNDALKLFKAKNLDIPFILITAALSDEVAINILKAGADDYILKDRLKRLPSAVLNSIERYRTGKEKVKLRIEAAEKVKAAHIHAEALSHKLLLATKTAGIGIWEYVISKKKFIPDEVLLELYGIESEAFDGTIQSWLQHVHPDDKERVVLEFENALQNSTGYETEFRIIWPDGSARFIKGTSTVQLDHTGKPIGLLGTNQDITKNKETEKVLRESESRLSDAQAVAKVGSWQTDFLTMDIMWSAETYRIFDKLPESNPVSHQVFLSYVHPDDKDHVNSAFERSLVEDKMQTIEHRIVTSEGIIKWVEERWRIIRDATGKPDCAVGTIQDITERKQAEQLIHESEAKYRAFFETSIDGILLTVTDGNILAANPAACEIFRMTEEEICSRGRFGLADAGDPRLSKLLEERKRTGKAKGELTLIRKDGSKFPGELTSAMFVDAYGQERTSMIIRDITARKNTEAENVFKAKLLNTIGQAVIATDADGRVNYWNKAAETLYGWTSEEAIGQNIINLTPAKQSREQSAEIIQQLMQGQSWAGEMVLQKKCGTLFPAFITNATIQSDDRRLSGIIGISNDITERKAAEQALKKSEAFNKSVLDSLSSNIAVVDAEGNIIQVNKSWETFALNNGATIDNCGIGSNYFKVCLSSTDDTDNIAMQALHGIKGVLDGSVNEFYLEYPCHSPVEQRWFYLRVKKFDSDEPMVLVEHQYITERKRAEEKAIVTANVLKQTLKDLNNILDSSVDIICTINKKGEFANVSAASLEIWGYTPAELVGRRYIDLVVEADKENTLAMARDIISGKPVTIFENRYTHKDGSSVPILWSARWDEHDELMYCIAKDATEKKGLEKAIEIAKERFQDLFLQAPSCMGVLKGPNHVYESVNPHLLQLINRTDVIDKTVIEVLPELVEQGIIEQLDMVYTSGIPFSAKEILIQVDKNNDGVLFDHYLNLIYQPYKNNEGIIEGIFFFAVDVTEQVLSRKQIEESEKKYRQIVETAQEGIWMIDKNNVTTFVNRKFCEILGYSAEEMIGRQNTYFMAEEGKAIAQQYRKKRKNVLNDSLQIPLVSKKGQTVWVTLSGTEIVNKDGEYDGGLAMVTDITEIRSAQQSIKASEQRFRQIVETAQEGIWMIDEHNITTFVNDKMCEILEYDREEIMGISNLTFKDHDEQKKAIEQIERRKKGIKETHEARYITKSGRHIWVNVSTNPVFDPDGAYRGALAMITDITKRKVIEKQLAQSEASLKRAQALADIGNWEIDLTDNKQIWSDELYNILGLIKESVPPSTRKFLSIIHPEDVMLVKAKLLEASKTLQPASFEYRVVSNEGAVKFCYTESRFEFDKSNNPVRMYGVVQNITHRKLTEIERTKMIKDIIQRNKELEQFTYIVSHNLRAPVANIIGFVSALTDPEYPQDLHEKFLSQLAISAAKLDDVTRDLNEVLLVKHKLHEVKEEINLSTIVNNIQISIQHLIDEYKVNIQTDFSEVESMVSIKSFMHSILYNLISNSIKYRFPGRDPFISIRTHQTADRIALIFSDNGSGIDLKRNNEKIFGLYKRFHLHIEGKGLGLFMTKAQIETLDGTIEVFSEVGEGTTFKIYFPISILPL